MPTTQPPTTDQLTHTTTRAIHQAADLLTTGGWGKGNYHGWADNTWTRPTGPYCLAGALNATTLGPHWVTHNPDHHYGPATNVNLTAKYALLTHLATTLGLLNAIGETPTPHHQGPFVYDATLAMLNDTHLTSPAHAVAALLAIPHTFIHLAAAATLNPPVSA